MRFDNGQQWAQNCGQETQNSFVIRLPAPVSRGFFSPVPDQWPGGRQLYNTRKGKFARRGDAVLSLPAASILLAVNPTQNGAVTMNNQLPAVFNFVSHTMRVVMRDGEPWFVAADVCAAIGITTEQTRRLDDDEKGLYSTQTPSGTQEMTVINESGLYSLILGSRKPEAKKFKKWVTSEVLPAIRKTGTYTLAKPAEPAPASTLSTAQHVELYQAVRDALSGGWEFGKNGEQWAWNRLRVKLNLRSINDMHPDQLPAALAEMKTLQEDMMAYFGFRSELREFIEREIIGAGTPWTASVARKYKDKMKTLVPPRPEWLTMQKQLLN